MGKPAVTDRRCLPSLSHSFTLDFLIVVHSQRAGQRVKASLARFLRQHLKLEINEIKSTVGSTNECVFLGFTFHGTPIYWSQEAFQDFRHRLRKLTGRSRGVSMAYRIRKLNEYIRGWLHYFGLSQYYRPLPELDAWLRRRLRMCFWKQWRYVPTKVRELLKSGTARKTAILTALSRKGPWHLSRTLATQTGMTNQWLTETLGLVSIRTFWISPSLSDLNRLVRTRMLGGVGAGEGNLPGYPIRLIWSSPGAGVSIIFAVSL